MNDWSIPLPVGIWTLSSEELQYCHCKGISIGLERWRHNGSIDQFWCKPSCWTWCCECCWCCALCEIFDNRGHPEITYLRISLIRVIIGFDKIIFSSTHIWCHKDVGLEFQESIISKAWDEWVYNNLHTSLHKWFCCQHSRANGEIAWRTIAMYNVAAMQVLEPFCSPR